MYKKIKEFLSQFQFADDDKKKSESIKYILDTLSEAEKTNKVLDFTKLEDVEYSPNPMLDRKGKLLFNTRTFMIMYNEYVEKVKYVKTEIANIVRENYVIMRDISNKPRKDKQEGE